ncbi:MAG: PASTA domain-containing protein [Clostridiales bacterium]|nr:PASTA domain-containing protein [Clostridiales bacterium]
MERQQRQRSTPTRRNTKPKANYSGRLKIIFTIFIICLSFVGFFRIFTIIYFHGAEYEARAINNQVSRIQDKTINANRGNIYDRNNQPLAVSNTVYTVVLDVRVLDEQTEAVQTNTFEGLSETLDIPISELQEYLAKTSDGSLQYDTNWQIIKKQVPYDTGKTIEEMGLSCVYLEEDTLRSYPNDKLASQLIGFIRGDTKWGLEAYYDDEMTGTPGRVFRTYEADDSIETRREEPVRGNSLVTTLDVTVQQYAETIAKTAYLEYESQNASVLVMNPTTGEVLAMAAYPSFSLNNPTEITQLEDEEYKTEWDNVMTDEEKSAAYNSAWKNYNITSTFEPGSIMKPLVVASALEDGSINVNDSFFCGGSKIVADYEIHCHNIYGHGTQTIAEVLAHSCNVGMMDIAYAMGTEKFYKYFKDWGFGEVTGIDLPNEASAASVIHALEDMHITELATYSFGQGFNCTPIQILTAFSAVINGGNLMKPYVVSQILDAEGNVVKETEPTIVRKVISEETSAWMRENLESVLEGDGTGVKARVDGYAIGGKTGTAEQGARDGTQWVCDFIAYLPIDDPQLICMVTIDRPVGGDSVSPAPQMKELLTDLIETYNITPVDEEAARETIVNAGDITLGDYTGYSLENAISQLNSLGLDYELIGDSGDTILRQFPAGGTIVDSSTKVLLYITIGDESNSTLQEVPDLSGLTTEQAQQAATALGFELAIENSNVDFDDSTSTAGASSQTAAEGTETETGAEATTEAAEEKPKEDGVKTVYKQSPSAGSKVPVGTTIKVKLE